MQNISRVFVSVHLPGLNSSVLQRCVCVCVRVSVRYLIEHVLESMSKQVFSNEEKRVVERQDTTCFSQPVQMRQRSCKEFLLM